MGRRGNNRETKKVRTAKSRGRNSPQTTESRNKRLRAMVDPMPQIIAQISQQGKSKDEWDTSITAQLVTVWLDRVAPADLKIQLAQLPIWWLVQIFPEALGVLDEIIIRQAGTLGWRIELSELVQRRLSEWGLVADGLELLGRYHLARERAARIHQGLEKPPLDDPELYRAKLETVKELRVLLSEMRRVYQARFCDPPGDLEPVLVGHFLKALGKRSKAFPFLAANREHWRGFLAEQSAVLRQQLAEVRLRPASLFDSWISWCKRRDQEWTRQTISRLGSLLRKPARNAKL
jgi:hypothetical protein